MNTSRRGTGRKNQNVPRESATQDISQFVYRRSKEELVEIDDDDDEVQDLTDQFAFAEEDVQPNPVKRRKKHLIFEDSDDDLDEIEGMDEDERRQMKEAIRQSKLQLEVEAKQRAAYATTDVKSISETGPAKPCRAEDNYSQDETQDCLSVQSSPTSSFVEKQQDERAESPDLFGTPRSSKEEPENIAHKPCSPSKSPFKSKTIFSADDLKSSLDKDIVINLTPVKRQLDSNNKNRLKLKKKESSRDQDKKAETTSKFESNGQNEDSSAVESKKRKLFSGDEDDDTEESGREFVVKDPKKKQKTMIEDVFNVKHLKKDDKEKRNNLDPHHIIVEDDDDDDDEGSMQDAGKVQKRTDPTTKMKKYRTTRLERPYRKPRLSIKTIKDAMKARLYFSPPGIDPKTYTYAIMRMMDHTRKRIYRAQRKSLNFIKWGKPIVVGPRETNSLDARKEKKKNHMGEASTSLLTSLEPAFERKRSLRSAQTSTAAPPIKIEPVSVSVREGHRKVRDYIESDDSDDDLTKPVFGEPASKPKPWKAHLSSKEPETFGENVITSTKYKENSVDTSTSKADSLASNAASSSFTGVQDILKNTEPNQKEVDEIDGEYMNGKRGRMNERLENGQKGAGLECKTKTDGRSPSKLEDNSSNQNAEISWIRQDNDIPEKKLEKQRTVVSEFVDKEEEEEIDSSIETGMSKSKKHPKKALIQDVEEEEEEEDSRGPLAKLGIEVKDEEEVGRDDDLLTTPEPARESKPGASLTNVATKSGYLKIERTPSKTPRVQRLMSSAARRAAEAAEKRMKASSVQSIQPSQEVIPSNEGSKIECPICFSKFYKEDIETHAANCDERTPKSNPTSFSPGKSTTSSESQKSIGSPANSGEPKNQDGYGLKNLRVMVTRSPEAHSRLLEQKSHSASKAVRRNLSLNKATRSAVGSADNQESRRSRRCIDMTVEDDNNPEIKKEGSPDEDSSPAWFSTTASQIERKKNKYKVTYGGKKRKQVDPFDNPLASIDHVYQEYPSSGDIGHDDDVGWSKESKEKKADTNDVRVQGASSFLTTKRDTISRDKYGDIESESDDSDVEMLATYGVKVESKKRKFEDKRSINDILRPRRQENPRKKKKAEKDFDDDDYENEMALLELSGVTLKECKVEKKSSNRSRLTKRRISSSEESEDNNDEFENCFICSEKVPKEDFKDHTDTCLEKKGECFVTPGKGSCEAARSNIPNRSRSKVKQSTAGSSEQTIEMDSDEISDSPVKTFKLIGEDSSSCVDFTNQFAFFKGGETKRRSRGSGRNKGGKYKGRGRYKRGRGKRKR